VSENTTKRPKLVHIVSHGPHCLDGVTAAVAVSRYHRDATVVPCFSSNTKIDETLLALRCGPPEEEHEIWITDISWTERAVDRYLQDLLDRGVRIYWIDHHRTALERYGRGAVTVRLTGQVLSEEYAASRLTYEYLCRRLSERGETNDWLMALQPLVAMADDNDRWLHRIPGSRTLALAVRAMHGLDAYEDLLHIDAQITYTARMLEAERQARAQVKQSLEVAQRSRVERTVPDSDLRLVAAVCDGHPSEVADAWGRTSPNTVFAIFDAKTLTVSLRRSPECTIDLSHVARHLGGGGHAAAAGCALPGLQQEMAEALASTVAQAIAQISSGDDSDGPAAVRSAPDAVRS
jgi:oligoribonuclease NrnB/cAMP/cGMP phosphodiesterase (DHH superfamily)